MITERKKRIVEISNLFGSLKFFEYEVIQLFDVLDDYGRYAVVDGTLSVCFLDAERMRDVHKKFLSDDSLTDVITFPGDPQFELAGEICVSPDYANDAMSIHGTSFPEELTLYLVHGYLHLAGLNDIQESDIREMRRAEQDCMNLLKSSRKVPVFSISQ